MAWMADLSRNCMRTGLCGGLSRFFCRPQPIFFRQEGIFWGDFAVRMAISAIYAKLAVCTTL